MMVPKPAPHRGVFERQLAMARLVVAGDNGPISRSPTAGTFSNSCGVMTRALKHLFVRFLSLRVRELGLGSIELGFRLIVAVLDVARIDLNDQIAGLTWFLSRPASV